MSDQARFKNILLLHFGQLGDVVMGLPAIRAFCETFNDSKITIITGEAAAPLVRYFGFGDEVIGVDRVRLLKGSKLRSIGEIFKLVAEVRRRKFDFVLDLHSLPETNLLGFLSGARSRLFANRESRSIDFLSNFRPRPEIEDKSKHLSDFYLSVLRPINIESSKDNFVVEVDPSDIEKFRTKYLSEIDGRRLVGLNIGAGHPSRKWPLERFGELTRLIKQKWDLRPVVFIGPEEEDIFDEIQQTFDADSIMLRRLGLTELAAAFKCIDLLIANDTGPPHLAAIVGTPIVLVLDERTPLRYRVLTKKLEIVNTAEIFDIPVKDVLEGTERLLNASGSEFTKRIHQGS